MKYLHTFLILFFLLITSYFAQNSFLQKNNEGYFSNPIKTKYGIIVSNEFESAIYLINGSMIEELVNAPGCGRFLSIDQAGNLIGFKLINPENGLQCPAILDLSNKKITRLADEIENAGQVSFADDGSIVYSVQNNLFVKKDSKILSYNLDLFSNRTPVSPDGGQIVYKDDSDQLWIFDLQSKNKFKFTDSKIGYGNATWSPDGKNILFTSIGTDIYVFNLQDKVIKTIGDGENPSWSNDGKFILYHKKEIDFNKSVLVNSDIYLSSSDGSVKRKLTDTPDEIELDARFTDSNKFIYHNYLKREIVQRGIENESLQKSVKGNIIFKSDTPLNLRFVNFPAVQNKIAKSNSVVDWVHIHQVWDTRNSGSWYQEGEGYVCCGATSAMEVLASYGILKPWPMTTFGHISNYGLYISDSYTFKGYTYSGYDGWPSGAHGYMWNGSGSPYANTVGFLKRHGITNSKRDEGVSWSNVITEINAGYPYIVCSTGLTAGHIVVIIGQSGTGHTVVCNDPYGDKNVGSYGAIRNGKNAVYDWSDANTGRVKVTPVVWAVTARYMPDIIPEIFSYSPALPEDSLSLSSGISIQFTQQMDSVSVEHAFSINPFVEGTLSWSDYHQVLVFKPNEHYAKSTHYNIKIDTTAKSIWGKNLSSSFEMEFNTKSREYLSAVNLYPQNNEENVSTTVQFNIKFDAETSNNAFVGNVLLFDDADVKVSLANVKIKNPDYGTFLSFEPKYPLKSESNYTVVYCSKINDIEDYFLKDTIKISFRTGKSDDVTGSVIDNFELIKDWKNPSYSSSTVGVDSLLSTFTISTIRKHNATYTGKLAYTFTDNQNGLCRIYNPTKFDLNSSVNSNLGLYVFGDNSRNVLELWFDENGVDKTVVIDTINWTGWKFKSVYLSSLNISGEFHFNSFVVRQSNNAGLSGEIYFDDLMTFVTTEVPDDNLNNIPSEFNLSQNYPNPFNPITTIDYSIPEDSRVQILIYNSIGEMIKEVVNESKLKGFHQVSIDGSNLSSGVYFYTMNAIASDGNKSYSMSRKLIILK